MELATAFWITCSTCGKNFKAGESHVCHGTTGEYCTLCGRHHPLTTGGCLSAVLLDDVHANGELKRFRLGRIAYEAYCETNGWKSAVSGQALPHFYETPAAVQVGWIAAAAAVVGDLFPLCSESERPDEGE